MSNVRTQVRSGAAWEEIVGYSRAVRIGNTIEVSGTTASKEEIENDPSPYGQSIAILKKIEKALASLDSEMKDVIRSRIYVTNIEHWESIGKAHAAFFKDIQPACTMVEVSRLIHPDILVEIEVSAIVD